MCRGSDNQVYSFTPIDARNVGEPLRVETMALIHRWNWVLLTGWNSGTDDRVGAKKLVSTAGSLKNQSFYRSWGYFGAANINL